MTDIHSMLISRIPSKTPQFHQNIPLSAHILPIISTKLKLAKPKRKLTVVIQAISSVRKDGDNIQSQPLISGSQVVKSFYDGINRHDLGSVHNLIALNCVYEDLVFPRPFVGRQSILEFFGKFTDSFSTDLQFVIDAISEEDSTAVGVTWHLEWKGKKFPFSKGCSFYQLAIVDGSRQIIYARDSVEPAIKPGESALIAIKGVTWLLQRFPNLVDRL